MNSRFALLLCALLLSGNAWARPQYAAKQGIVNCSACHASPFGGGPRNINGKYYGTHGLGVGENSAQDKVSGDFRIMLLEPNNPQYNPNGLVMMSAIPSGNLQLSQSDGGSETRAVVAYDLGMLGGALGAGLRDSYVRFRSVKEEANSFLKYVLFGRFNVPFGILTDEHRTYVRIQTRTTHNEFEMGFGFSGEPDDRFHYDLALTTGVANGGSALITNDIPWAAIANLRWNPGAMPFFLGASGTYQRRLNLAYNPHALSLSGALSLDRLTNGGISGSLMSEIAWAHGFNDAARNPAMARYFLPANDPAFAAAVADSTSIGLMVQAEYNLTQRWTLLYKFEDLALDMRFTGDAFIRHAFGFRTILNSNMDLDLRYEIGLAGRPSITDADLSTARNDLMGVFRYWF